MAKRGRLRYLVPIVAVVLVLLIQSNVPRAGPLLVPEKRAGDYSFRELGELLPEGLESLVAATPWDSGAVLVGYTNNERPVLARYRAADASFDGELQALPPHFAAPDRIARSGNFLMFGGDSLGTFPALGLYDGSSSQVTDVTNLLPLDVRQTSLIVGGEQSFLIVGDNDTGYALGIFETNSQRWSSLEASEFVNLAEVNHGVWNGATFYVGGEKKGGVPALLSVSPGGGVVDMSDEIPGDMTQVNHLVWAGDALYIFGTRPVFSTTEASMAVHVPSTGNTTSLTPALRSDYSKLEGGVWNGTALIVLASSDSMSTLMAYYPSNDSSRYADDVLPPNWQYQGMIQSGQSIVMTGINDSPFVGHLTPSNWTWEEKERVFETQYRVIHHAHDAGGKFVIGGVRRASAALAVVDTASMDLEDWSDALGLRDTVIYGTAGDEDWLLLAGTNGTHGVLYGYEPANGTLQSLTWGVPEQVGFLHNPSQVGNLFAIPGYGSGKTVLVVYDSEKEAFVDLSPQVQRYFDSTIRVVTGGDSFFIIGENDAGPALAILEPSTTNISFAGRALASLYGPTATLMDAAWSGESLLIAGTGEGQPLLGAWRPSEETYEDLSQEVPEDFGMITAVAWTGDAYAIGGLGPDGAALGAYYPTNHTFVDLRALVPPAYAAVTAVASRGNEVLVVSMLVSSNPSIGVMTLEGIPGPFAGLPAIIGEPAGAIILGLSVALAVAVGYVVGRRTGRPPRVQTAPPPPYPEIPTGHPEEFPPGYLDEYETRPYWYNW